MTETHKKGWLRAHGHTGSRVTFLELFFDLVFVFSISQLSRSLPILRCGVPPRRR